MYSFLKFNSGTLPGHLQSIPGVINEPNEIMSQYNTSNRPVRLAENLYYVCKEYLYGSCFIGKKDDRYYLERQVGNKYEIVILNKFKSANNIERIGIKAGIIDANNNISDYILSDSEHKGTSILIALMPLILENSEAMKALTNMEELLKINPEKDDWLSASNISDLGNALALLSDNLYYRFNELENCGTHALDMKITSTNNGVLSVRQNDLSTKVIALKGTPIYFGLSTKEEKTEESFNGKYSLSTKRNWTKGELELVPTIPKWYKMLPSIEDICIKFKETSSFPSPMRTALLRGVSGSGKTEGARAVFAGLGLPYDHYTCNEDTEIFDLLGQFVPSPGDDIVDFNEIRNKLGLPNTDEIINDPEKAYEKIHGIVPTVLVDEGELIKIMIEKVMQEASKKNYNSKDFKYVESGLIRACRNGYGFEIQEIGSVKRAGVAVGLNALLESGENNFITLPTGETIKKHPDTCVIFTSNIDYEGCAFINQSVLSRMAIVVNLNNPQEETMKERIVNRTGYKDQKILERMIKVIKDINTYCHEMHYTSGVCGVRELENWVMAVIVDEKVYGSVSDELIREEAIKTVLNKTSQIPEEVSTVITGCLNLEFAE